MYRLIACDLDETLLDKEGHVSEPNIKAVQAACQAGVKFVLATGRGFRSVQQSLTQLGLVGRAGEYVISFNGGAITENQDNQLIEFQGLSFEIIAQLFHIGLQYDVGIHVYTIDKVYLYNCKADEIGYMTQRVPDYIVLEQPDIEFLHDQPMAKILFQNSDKPYLQKIASKIEQAFPGQLSISYSSHRYVEFNKQGVDKGSALLALAKKLNIPQQQIMAIGDNSNDLTMIQAAGLGISVQNGIDELKACSGYVSTADHNNHAIAEIIEKFILNPS